MKSFKVGARAIGEREPVFLIAEVALFHDGSLGNAMALVDALAEAGVDAVKFQTHIAENESSPEEKFRVPIFPQDQTRFDYWKRTAFSEEEWRKLYVHARDRGVIFMSTPFSIEAARMLKKIGVNVWKVGSGEMANKPLHHELASYGDPVILSSGMSYFTELVEAISFYREKQVPLALLQCTNMYPCPPEALGLKMIQVFRDSFHIPSGLSDHSGMIGAGISAVSLGASILEFHVTWSKKCFGPDVSSSLTIEEVASLVKNVRYLEKSFNVTYEKDAQTNSIQELRKLFFKSIVLAKDIEAGTILTCDYLAYKKPGTGILAEKFESVLGRRVLRNLSKNSFLSWNDLE